MSETWVYDKENHIICEVEARNDDGTWEGWEIALSEAVERFNALTTERDEAVRERGELKALLYDLLLYLPWREADRARAVLDALTTDKAAAGGEAE